MDPLMRKLFQPREAREKLRGMGGIMSSSPQLASTVAKFQQGGPIQSRSLGMPSAPDAPLPSAGRARATRVGDRTFVLTDDGRVLDAQTGAPATPEVEAEVRSRLSPQLNMMDIVGGVSQIDPTGGGVNPAFREDTSGQLPPMPSDRAPMSVPADPRAPFDMDAFQRDLTGAGRAVAGPGLMAIDELSYGGPFLAPANDTSAAEAAIDRRMNADAVIDAPADGTSFAEALSNRPRMADGDSGGFSLSNVGPNLETLTAPFIGTDRDAEIAQIEAQLSGSDLSEFQREALETRLMGLRPIPGTEGVVDAVTDFGGRVLRTPGDLLGKGLSLFGATDAGAAVSEAFDPEFYDANSPKYRNALGTANADTPTAPVADAVADAVTSAETAETPVADVEPPVAETTAETPAAPTIDVDLDDPSTYDTDFEEMMRRLGGATGKEDKSSRQKAMADLAMIGLAIAAGQSPDALTNIAQGALTGMKAVRAEGAAKDAVASETRALATKLATDMEIARIRVPSGGGTYTPDRMLAQAVDSILAQPDFFEVFGADGKTVDMAKVAKKAQELVTNVAATRIVVQDGVRFQELPDGTYKELGS